MKEYNFQKFCSALHNFCSNELSAFYFDIRKDVIYCDKSDSQIRLSCLTVMNEIFLCIVHWLAPILSFTAEEAWRNYHLNNTKKSIHLNTFPEIPSERNDNSLIKKWNTIKDARKVITTALETDRLAKTIGSSLEAEIFVYASDKNLHKILSSIDLAEISIVSKATVINAQIPSNATTTGDINVGVIVRKAFGAKCERCWKISEQVVETKTEFGIVKLCDRCQNSII
jgi:isoleucyl-tRNA synthetase